MPLYDFKCDECNHVESDVFKKMVGSAPELCPKCQKPMHTMPVRTHTDLKEFHTPIELYSVASEDLGEIRKMKAACPDADISDDPRDPMYGVPIARNRKAKLQVLAAAGFKETN